MGKIVSDSLSQSLPPCLRFQTGGGGRGPRERAADERGDEVCKQTVGRKWGLLSFMISLAEKETGETDEEEEARLGTDRGGDRDRER